MVLLCSRKVESMFISKLFSHADSATPWTAAHQASLSFTISWSLLKLMPIELEMPFLSCLQSFPASALLIRWSKYWSFNFSISPSNEYSRLMSFRIDWLDLLAVQGTLENLGVSFFLLLGSIFHLYHSLFHLTCR